MFRWTSKTNDDVFITVAKSSYKFEPGAQILIAYPGPEQKRHEGWYVFFTKRGDVHRTVLKARVRDGRMVSGDLAREINPKLPKNMKRVWMGYPENWRGPWTQAHAIGIARHVIASPDFNAKWNQPKKYNINIPGWEVEDFKIGIRWVNKNDGRHLLTLKDNWNGTHELKHSIGYRDDPPASKSETIVAAKLTGKAHAIKMVRTYAEGQHIPMGRLERRLLFLKNPRFAEQLQKMTPEKLEKLAKKIQSKEISPDTAVKSIIEGEDQ